MLGGGRSIEETWDLMKKNNLCDWFTIEDFWRSMGHSHFPGAFLVRRNRGSKHGSENSQWVGFVVAKKIDNDLKNEVKGSRQLATGQTLGEVAAMYGYKMGLFPRLCGGIAKRYGMSLDQVYLELGSAPPPIPNWQDEITVQHQGQEYSIKRISREGAISPLNLYWRWLKGMYLIDDSIAFRLQRTRTTQKGRLNQMKRLAQYDEWQA
jgi:hypothetical protein